MLCLGFVTEVHHVNGRGENKGVVYCEMQVSYFTIPVFVGVKDLYCDDNIHNEK